MATRTVGYPLTTFLKEHFIMPKATTKQFALEIDAHLNTKNRSRNQWAQITDARSGRVLHTGQPCYIKQVAKKKYNTVLNF
jgi:hypothetical protein